MQATCEDAALFCNTTSRASLRARQFCPHTCGCDNPRSGQAFGLPIGGCPPSCSRAASYQQALNNTACEDVPRDDPNFVAFITSWRNESRVWPKDFRGRRAT